jgi:hypothetical protein
VTMLLATLKIKVTMVSKCENIRIERSLIRPDNFKGKFIELWKVEFRAPSFGVLA